MSTLDIAIQFIKTQVERGDTIEDLMNSQMGGGCKEYHCSINHNIYINNKRVPRDTIVVERVGEEVVNKVYKLQEIIDLIKKSVVQPPLFIYD